MNGLPLPLTPKFLESELPTSRRARWEISCTYNFQTGKIVAVNSGLDKTPEVINSDPYGSGWIAEIEISGGLADAPGLLSAPDYEQLTA